MVLSKSKFVAGCQCPKLLWWSVHEPLAEELQPDKVLLDRFDQGRLVGELARERFPGGLLIGRSADHQLEPTQAALATDAPAVFEASFESGGVKVAADILLRDADGFTLIEAKSTTSAKDEHTPDAAVQAWVLRESGLSVHRIEVMHLNKEYRHPGVGDLLVRTDVTEAVEAFLPQVAGLVAGFSEILEGSLPATPIGAHCFEPRECPFMKRCWPDDPEHISTLYNTGPKGTVAYMAQGVHRIWDIPAGKKLPPAAARQLRALRENRLIVEPGLAQALDPFERPLGFLDFETVARAVPVWDGLAPWGQATAQFS